MASGTSGEYNFLFKMMLVGSSSVGKSSLLLRFTDDCFNENYISTIGVDFKIKTVTIDSTVVKLQIWDTAGQERFKTLTSSYYKGAHGIFVVYDVTDRESFQSIGIWLNEIEKNAAANVSKMLLGNKADMDYKRKVSKSEGQALAKKYGMKFIETSAKQSFNVHEAFKSMAQDIQVRLSKTPVATGGSHNGSFGKGKEKVKRNVGVKLTSKEEEVRKPGCCGK